MRLRAIYLEACTNGKSASDTRGNLFEVHVFCSYVYPFHRITGEKVHRKRCRRLETNPQGICGKIRLVG